MPAKTRGMAKTPAKAKGGRKARTPAANRYAAFPAFCARMGLPRPIAEYQFHPSRKWRLDWYWPDHKLALEIQGGCFIKGGHSTGVGLQRDHEKFSECAPFGIRIVLCQPRQVFTPALADLIRRALDWKKTL